MRLPKRDQNLLAEAYDTVTTVAANSTRSMGYNTDRQLNRIRNLLSQKGYREVENHDEDDIQSKDGSLHITTFKAGGKEPLGIITKRTSEEERAAGHFNTFVGIVRFYEPNLKKAKKMTHLQFTTTDELRNLSGVTDVLDDPESATSRLSDDDRHEYNPRDRYEPKIPLS